MIYVDTERHYTLSDEVRGITLAVMARDMNEGRDEPLSLLDTEGRFLALSQKVQDSSYSFELYVDGYLLALFGFNYLDLATGAVYAWLIPTKHADHVPITSARVGREVLSRIEKKYSIGTWLAAVENENIVNQRFAEWLGFESFDGPTVGGEVDYVWFARSV